MGADRRGPLQLGGRALQYRQQGGHHVSELHTPHHTKHHKG